MRSLVLASLFSLASIAQAQTLTTTHVGGLVLTGFGGANTVYCDMTVTNPTGIYVSQIDFNCQAGPTGTLEVYRTANGIASNTNRTNPVAWRKIGTAPIAAIGAPATGVLNEPFFLAAGTYGIALHHIGVQAVYTNPATPVPALPTVYSDANLTITCTNSVTQNSTPTNPISGAVSAAPRLPNISVTYSLTGHTSDFSLSPAAGGVTMQAIGASPLSVTFTDESSTSDPLGLLPIWDWDFDGDGINDLTTAVPTATFNYTTCGTYNVRLTSYDIVGPVTTTKTAIVTVDPLSASFTFAKTGDPAVFTFTDTTVGATGWAWDLDPSLPGIESTAQNPVYAYAPGCAPVNVTLTATNACRSSSKTLPVVPEPSIVTLFNANNSGAAGTGNLFDVNITNPDGIQICGFAVNLNEAVGGTPIQLTFYEKTGTYVGFDTNAAAWTNRGTVLGTASLRNQETLLTLPTPVYLSPGSHGFAIFVTGVGLAYSGTGTNPAPGATSYSNADMTLSLGIARSALFGGTLFNPRIWNGRINYKTVTQGMAGYYTFASGCAGSVGVPGNVGVSLPTTPGTLTVNFPNTPFAALVFYGFSNTLAGGVVPLPVDAGFLGAPGCPIHIDPAVQGPLLIGANPTWNESIPSSPGLIGVHFYTQAFSLELPGFNALGGALGDAAAAVVGS